MRCRKHKSIRHLGRSKEPKFELHVWPVRRKKSRYESATQITDHPSPLNRLYQCDGIRPSCGRCAKKGEACEYDAHPDIPRSLALRLRNEHLQSEVDRLRALLGSIRNGSEAEAEKSYQQLRATSIPQHLNRSIGDSTYPLARNGSMSGMHESVSIFDELDLGAKMNCKNKVHARPWTTLAGDDLVSELVSAFFVYDHCFRIPFVDQDCFLNDMRAGDITRAKFCSPLLVNAICALRCVSAGTRQQGNSLTESAIAYLRASQTGRDNRRSRHR